MTSEKLGVVSYGEVEKYKQRRCRELAARNGWRWIYVIHAGVHQSWFIAEPTIPENVVATWHGPVAHEVRIFNGTETLGVLPAGFTANVQPGKIAFESTAQRFLAALTANPPKGENAIAYFEIRETGKTRVAARYVVHGDRLVWVRALGSNPFPQEIER